MIFIFIGFLIGILLGGVFAYVFFIVGRTQAVAEIEAKTGAGVGGYHRRGENPQPHGPGQLLV